MKNATTKAKTTFCSSLPLSRLSPVGDAASAVENALAAYSAITAAPHEYFDHTPRSFRVSMHAIRKDQILFLRCRWVVALVTPKRTSDGDRVKAAIERARQVGRHYELVREIESADGKVVEIYHLAEVSGPLRPE
jgi:hypothetical protein